MDVNGTRFHLILGKNDWKKRIEDKDKKTMWDEERCELILKPKAFEFLSSPYDKKTVLEDRRGAACDKFCNWYWIGKDNTEILMNMSGSGETIHYWSVGDGQQCKKTKAETGFIPVEQSKPPVPIKMSGLTITEDNYLVAGSINPAGIIIFDLISGGPPYQMIWPQHIPFVPFDMIHKPGGGLYILDKDNYCYWIIDRQFNITGDGKVELPKVFEPIAIESLPDGSVLILHKDSVLLSSSTSNKIVMCDQPKVITAHDFAYVPAYKDAYGEMIPERLYITGKDGNQSLVLSLLIEKDKFKLEIKPEYYPMRLFGGKGIVTASNQVFYDFGDRWIPLVKQFKPRYEEDAIIYTDVFDGKEPDCVWHRLMLDASIPPDTSVTIWSRTENEYRTLDHIQWQPEPPLYKRSDGSEIPYIKKTHNTYELLFQKAKGRYLHLRIEITGNGRTTPRLRALRIYYPRFSYLKNYLPAVYREDSISASFLDRFLANPEGFFTSTEDKVAAVQVMLDARSTPTEALDWLISWFGIASHPAWDDDRKRLFIKHAIDFFQYRGTTRGLQMALHLVLDKYADETIFFDSPNNKFPADHYRIVEEFRKRFLPVVSLGQPLEANKLPRYIKNSRRWTPEQGVDELHRKYKDYMQSNKPEDKDKVWSFPIKPPEDKTERTLWETFTEDVIGFIPLSGTCCTCMGNIKFNKIKKMWQDFLARRYRAISALNSQYKTEWKNFEDVTISGELPQDGIKLQDWFHFECVVLQMNLKAHRFTVYIPVPEGGVTYSLDYQLRLELAKKIIEIEKPAHTIFDVKFYWAMFRVGEVRLGYNTLLDKGSRAQGFMDYMVLGRKHIGENTLSAVHSDIPGRYSIGETQIH